MSTPSLRPHTKWGVAVALGVIGSLLVGLVVLAFLWPSKTSEAHNLPVGITGPAATVTALEEALDKAAPGTFDFVEANDRDAAVSQIQKRETYGAIVLAAPPAMPEVLAGFAVAVGLVLTFILHTWFEYLPGDFAVNALAMGASILATSSFIVGCASLLGRGGIALGAVTTMLVANPISAAAVPWQFLAEPWGAIGQWFVPGAANTLIRSVAYFPDADVTRQWWILAGWIVLGVVLTLIGHFRARATMHVPEATVVHEAEPPAEVLAAAH